MNARGITRTRAVWLALVCLSIAFLVFSAGTAYQYTQVSETKVMLEMGAVPQFVLLRNSTGALERLILDLGITVVNIGPRDVNLWVVAYKAWLRDYEAEAFPQMPRALDDAKVEGQNGTTYWARAFSASFTIDDAVLARGERSFALSINASRPGNETLFKTVEDIARYAARSRYLNDSSLEWLQFANAVLFVSGVPRDPSSFTGAQNWVPLIQRTVGYDIGPGGS
ncbi:MAG: hypothetical protein HZB92_08815 [Euryarchaeota archaeon]|nr:hypothetical protein [Euryarchaeota archaeon]